MICNVRLDISDEERRLFKERFGMVPSRNNFKNEVRRMLTNALYPDGKPVKKATKFKLSK